MGRVGVKNYKAEGNIALYVILCYLWMLVAKPQLRFEILGALQIEKILVVLSFSLLAMTGRLKLKFNAVSGLIIIFYAWMLLSFSLSQYQNYMISQLWSATYWKLLVIYFLLLFSLNSKKDILFLIAGFVIIVGLYQAHSWVDFLNGGNYVYQQGVKRIIGVWTSGIGAANDFAFLCLISLPFAQYWFKLTENSLVKKGLIFFGLMTLASIFYSGTRGALVGVLALVFLNMGSFKQVFKYSLLLFLLLIVTYAVLPQGLKHRYFGFIVGPSNSAQINSRADQVASISAQDRIQGLHAGWKLALMSPVIGYGPGSSALARKRVNLDSLFETERNLQLHNLYGQVMGELGFVGLAIFSTLLIIYFIKLRGGDHSREDEDDHVEIRVFLKNSVLLMLVYGLINHNLYEYYWFLFFAIHGGFRYVLLQSKRKVAKAPLTKATST